MTIQLWQVLFFYVLDSILIIYCLYQIISYFVNRDDDVPFDDHWARNIGNSSDCVFYHRWQQSYSFASSYCKLIVVILGNKQETQW